MPHIFPASEVLCQHGDVMRDSRTKGCGRWDFSRTVIARCISCVIGIGEATTVVLGCRGWRPGGEVQH